MVLNIIQYNTSKLYKQKRRLTLMAVGSGEAGLTGTGEVASGLADTSTMRATNIRTDLSHTPVRAVTRHGNRTAVNHYKYKWEINQIGDAMTN